MTDSLTVFGTDYTGVTGIKAKGTNNGTLTYIRPQGTKSINANGTGIDVAAYASVDVNVPTGGGTPSLQSKSVSYTPTETAQSATVTADSGYDGLSSVDISVGAISSTYVGSGITQRSSTDLTGLLQTSTYDVTAPSGYYDSNGTFSIPRRSASNLTTSVSNGYLLLSYDQGYYPGGGKNLASAMTSTNLAVSGATVTAPAGYYATAASKSVAVGSVSASATKSISNHTATVTPSASVTAGYIDNGATGTAVTVSASELVDGTLVINSSGTKDVTNYASASVAAGGATASATKGSVSNHSVTVTPSVTKTAGYIAAGTANGTAVTVSASELVSGSETKTANGTYDVTNLASLVVALDFSTIYTSSSNPTSSQGSNGDIWLVTS